MYDAIVVGARCAGSPTAMLLARNGYKVLLMDRSGFPSDTISTHVIWPPGASRLKRWGLLERIAASNCPPIRKLTLDVGDFALSGSLPPFEGVDDCYAPRRTVLDKILVDAAAEAGVEVREHCAVEGLINYGDQVIGVRCRSHGGAAGIENARIVIGADGRNSIVARSVEASQYNVKPTYACWYYSYWSGVPIDGIEFYMRPGNAIGYIPTNDAQVCLPISSKHSEFDVCRTHVESSYMSALEAVPQLVERVREGERVERYFGTGDVPNFFRVPFGAGWALVGDAGYHKDPIGAQGISDAFRDAENLTAAIDAGFSGTKPIDAALAEYQQKRDAEVMPMYELNSAMASLEPPPPEMQQLFDALRDNMPDTEQFLGMLAGSVPVTEFLAPDNTQRIISASG